MAPKKNYPKEQMAAALEAVAKGMPVATAAKEFSVPRTTLLYKATGKSPKECPMGPETILTSIEESMLVEWILNLAKMHYPVSKEQLLDSVQLVIQNTKRKTPFIDCRPGRKWFELFLKRHPELSIRLAQNLTPARENVKENQLRQWFAEIEEYLKAKDLFKITNDPTRVFNSDESAFFLQPKGGKVLARKGDRNVYYAGTNDEKENLTVLVTSNANGDIAPPMVVFKYQRIPSHIAYSLNKKWGIGRSDSGWMCGPTFFEYITNVFVPWLNEKDIHRPVLLFVDGHLSHMTLALSQYCAKNGIELLALYPNSTHLIQPMDVSVFKPLKTFWKQCVRKWHIDNYGVAFKKEHFGNVFEEALDKITKETIKSGFRTCGLSPFGVENVNFIKISTMKSSGEINTYEREKLKQCLKILECHIEKETLDIFKVNKSKKKWMGKQEDTSLFGVWQKINSKVGMGKDEEINGLQPSEDSSRQPNDIETVEEYENSEINKKQNKSLPESMDDIIDNLMNPMPCTSRVSDLTSPKNTQTLSPGHVTGTQKNLMKTPENYSPTTKFKNHIPTPFKKALFFPEPQQKKTKREKIPSAITSEAWQNYHQKKQRERERKEEEKKKRREERENRRKEMEFKKKEKYIKKQKANMKTQMKSKRKRSDSETTEDEEWIESGESVDDVDLEEEADEDDIFDTAFDKKVRKIEVGIGDFVLAKLTGRKGKMDYKYLCVIQAKHSDNDIEVTSLKSINIEKTTFKLIETDVFTIKSEDIIEKLPLPTLENAGDRIKYVFTDLVDVYEA